MSWHRMVRALAIIGVVGFGALGTASSTEAHGGPQVGVYQKLVDFRLQNEISVQGSGFAPDTTVTVTVAASQDGSVSSMSTHSVKTDSHGKFDTGVVQTVSCPIQPTASFQATAGGTSSDIAPAAC